MTASRQDKHLKPGSDFTRFCVFCGGAPRGRTNEHVVPLWLIELTGNPNRRVNLHTELTAPLKTKTFAFDQFQFPACGDCNGRFAHLEQRVEPIMRAILQNGYLDECDWDVLLSWFDKVRVGLWLSKYFLGKNSLGLKPRFQIAQRIDIRDRAILLFRRKSDSQGLTFGGTFLPSFDCSPTSFALFVNNYMFVNLTSTDLCSHRLGFPSFQPIADQGDRIVGKQRLGIKRVISPVLRGVPHIRGTGIYQPIYHGLLTGLEDRTQVVDEYVSTNSLDEERGIGGVFLQKNGKAARYPGGKSNAWLPPSQLTNRELVRIAHSAVYQHQIAEMQGAVRIGSAEQKKSLRELISGCRKALKTLLEC